MKANLISVIMPVYNASRYLHDTVNCLLAQKNKNFELILIDDGSNDNSYDICKEFATKDSRIIVLHKSNGGVSSARNLGLQEAKGNFVTFIDSDDIIDSDFLTLEKEALSCDVIIKPFSVQNGSQIRNAQTFSTSFSILDKKSINEWYVQKRNNALWDKIINRRIIEDNRFDENLKVGEDFLFFFSFFHRIKSVYFSPIGKYIYIKRENSAMNVIANDMKKKVIVDFHNIALLQYFGNINNEKVVAKGLIAQEYLFPYLHYIKYLSIEQKKNLKDLLMSYKIQDLAYLKITKKVKFVMLRLIILIRIR